VGVSSLACSFFVDVFIHQMAEAVGPLVFLRPAEAFIAKLKLSVTLGCFFAVPVLIYHFWRYVGVALTISERKVVLGALPFAYLLFAAGAALSWFALVPTGLKFLMTFGSPDIRPMISVDACLQFAVWTTLGMGVLFQIPVVVAALAHWGLVRSAALRFYRRHVLLGILVLAAVLTPSPDVASQLLLAFPTYLLFEVSILVARFLEPKDSSA
jgi:sec-independent protein translocase protein TatC